MTTELEQPFDAPWQARAFALTLYLHGQGLFSWGDWTHALGAAITAAPERPYYESWLEALQGMLTSRLALASGEIAEMQQAWLDAAARTAHGQPIELDPAAAE